MRRIGLSGRVAVLARLTMLVATAAALFVAPRQVARGDAMSAATTQPMFVQPQDIDSSTLLAGPPADDSPEHQAEVATMLYWQNKRTKEDVARCRSEVNVNVFVFAEVLGDWFNERSLPLTSDLLQQAYTDTYAASYSAKQKWKRVRPPLADPRIHPCVPLEKTPSYPSGHATRGVMWAILLSEIFPEHRDALMARGRLIGDDRYIAGMHYPTDVEAGQKLGEEVARRMLENHDFMIALDRAKEECMEAAMDAAHH
jgi:acid phosphatase (class A)